MADLMLVHDRSACLWSAVTRYLLINPLLVLPRSDRVATEGNKN